jgi:hypothetical protein
MRPKPPGQGPGGYDYSIENPYTPESKGGFVQKPKPKPKKKKPSKTYHYEYK